MVGRLEVGGEVDFEFKFDGGMGNRESGLGLGLGKVR